MVLGIVLTVIVVMVAPKWLKSDGDGFFRPQPNPDAQPARVGSAGEDVTDGAAVEAGTPAAAAAPAREREYDFYTVLPGKEVPLSDAELAATERAEEQRLQALQTAQARQDDALPEPVDTAPAPTPTPPAAAATPATSVASAPDNSATAAGAGDGSRYLLQAGAFQASGQAEELKARIALLGLGARVEAAQIGGNTVYRVRMGPYGTATDLAEAKRKLSSGGLDSLAIKVQ